MLLVQIFSSCWKPVCSDVLCSLRLTWASGQSCPSCWVCALLGDMHTHLWDLRTCGQLVFHSSSHQRLICCVFCPQILDKLLDRESQTHKPQTLSSFYSSKPAAGSQRSPSKHSASSHSAAGAAAGVVSKHGPSSSSSTAASLPAPSSSSAVVVLSGDGVADLKPVQSNTVGEGSAESREHGK